MAEANSPISNFYNDRSVFVTGATGFMGKVLLEKLLRSCHGIKTIYVLLRSKKGTEPHQRYEKLLQSQVFDLVKERQPEAISKLLLIEGDILQQSIGISETNELLLIKNVSIVFHLAATVKFDEKLKLAVDMNVLGTRRVIELCQKMEKLEALVHISTAYSNCNKKHIDEVVYKQSYSYKKIIDVVQWLDDKTLDKISNDVLEGRPNTYTYSKALAENLLLDEGGSLPIAIVRPTIVCSSWKEPFPGWSDCSIGFNGICFAIGKGALKAIIGDTSMIADLIPIDAVTNIIIAVAWHTALQRSNYISVYNCSSRSTNSLTWGTFESMGNLAVVTFPFSDTYFYPHCILIKSEVLFKFAFLFYHYIPAYLYDFYRVLRGRNPVAVYQYSKIYKALQLLKFFLTHEWIIDSTNVLELNQTLCPSDKKKFNFDIERLDWSNFIITSCEGARKYLEKEEPITIPSAKKKLKRKYIYTTIWQIFLCFIIFLIMITVYKMIRYMFLIILKSHN